MVILDSNILIWLLRGDRPLSKIADETLEQHPGKLSISIASVWEIEIKRGMGKLDLGDFNWETSPLVASLDIIPITIKDTVRAGQLLLLHRDPFDRMIIAQTLNRAAVIITTDDVFRDYGATVILG